MPKNVQVRNADRVLVMEDVENLAWQIKIVCKKIPMFFKKSTALILLIALIFTLSLSGCRKKSPAEKSKTYEGIELTYYKMFDDGSVIDPVIKEYEATHPGLKIKYKKFTNFDEYQKVVLNEMAEGEGPDIFSMQNTWFMSNYKKIAPMPTDLGSTEDFLNTFVDVAFKDLVRPDKDGVERIYALPM
ncbi:MAG: extracellular solute-binding protein, partial [Patescibacteria group bacterium]